MIKSMRNKKIVNAIGGISMALFGFGKKNNNISRSVETVNSANTETPTTNSSAKVILKKAEAGLDRHIVRLKKEQKVDLDAHRARVFVVIDRSGSMTQLYKNGAVQDVLTRLLPLALKFDDNGELEVYVFNTCCNQMSSMNLQNYEDYVKCEIMRKGFEPSGCTKYSPVVEQTISDYNDGSPYPAFGIFITDGENDDTKATDKAIRKSSKYKIFYQFVGIGNEKFKYLQKLDDLDGRKVDNTAFVKVSDFAQLDDDELYAKLLEQYPQWLRAMNII